MDHQGPVEIDPATLASSQRIWSGFTSMIKYNVIAIVILLLGMAVFLT